MDRDTFDEFVRGRSIALGRTAYLLTGNAHDAEDLVQTALARAATRWSRIDNPEAYVRRMLYTTAVSRWRQLRRLPAEVLGHAQTTHIVEPVPELEIRLVLQQALGRLTPRQRAVLVLRFYEDRTEAQTAELLGCAIGTVKSQTRHALRRLRILSPELAALVGGDEPGMVARDAPERTARA